jgi:hypothetical protein
MLRTAFGAFDALVGGSAAQGAIVRETIGRRIWTGNMSARGPVAPWNQRALISKLAAPRPTVTRSKFIRVRTPLFKPRRPFHSSRPRRAAEAAPKNGNAPAEESLSLSQRLKKLSREYGWTAVGIYLALSVLDFPFCFLLVRTVGTEKIGESTCARDYHG